MFWPVCQQGPLLAPSRLQNPPHSCHHPGAGWQVTMRRMRLKLPGRVLTPDLPHPVWHSGQRFSRRPWGPIVATGPALANSSSTTAASRWSLSERGTEPLMLHAPLPGSQCLVADCAHRYLHEAPARVVTAFWLPYAINIDLLRRCASLSFLSSPPAILPSSLDE